MAARRIRRKKTVKSPAQAPTQRQRALLKARVPRLMATLDRAAVEWAALLNDPCNARLTYACYPVGDSNSILMRVESDTILFSGSTETAGQMVFVPGLGIALTNLTPATSDTSGSTLTRNASISPGEGFIAANAASLRCVAACTQVTYPGTELNRSGVVGIGLTGAGNFLSNLTTGEGGGNANASAQTLRILTQHVERMPSTMVECKWFPGDGDAESFNYALRPAAWGQALNGRNAIAVSASGFPVSTGIRIRNVAVYELALLSSVASGQVQALAPPVSSSTTGSVLRFLYSKDPQWYLESAAKLAAGARTAISYVRAGVKAAGMAANGLALLAA